MSASQGLARHALSPSEHKALLDAERRAAPFLAYRDGIGDLRFAFLGDRERASIGRAEGNDVILDWDREVSRSHAQVERIGSDWALVDDGLSRNGSQVNGERIVGRRRLSDGDVLRIGQTTLVFRAPGAQFDSTHAAGATPIAHVTAAERRVLVELCVPFAADGGPAPAPATNRDIASALNVSTDSVKKHVRSLFEKLGVEDLPQYQKRTELARRALEHGLVTRADALAAARDRRP
jgi:predicted component of type VI protein secretion system